MSAWLLKLAVIFVGITTLASFQLPDSLPPSLTENPLSLGDQQKAQALTESIQAAEWLGPLAPIAISPFFGITCLAAISQFGGDYLPVNSFVSNNPVLNNPTIFWIFLALTLLTSLPRFTKVSKPAAQAIDQVEAYAGIITILIIRFLPGWLESTANEPATAMVVQMGFLTITADLLMAVAAIINIVVINTVKFFFEVLVWLIPVPFVDAALEISNKAVCAGLMFIYAWSPIAATVINLLLFGICLIIFRWVHRRVTYAHAILGHPLWAMISPRFGVPRRNRLTVFPKDDLLGFAAKSKLILQPTEAGWQLIKPRFWGSSHVADIERADWRLQMKSGFLVNSIEIVGAESGFLLFSRRYGDHLDELAELIKVDRSADAYEDDLKTDLAKA